MVEVVNFLDMTFNLSHTYKPYRKTENAYIYKKKTVSMNERTSMNSSNI